MGHRFFLVAGHGEAVMVDQYAETLRDVRFETAANSAIRSGPVASGRVVIGRARLPLVERS